MKSILDNLADNITIKLHEDVDHSETSIVAVKAIDLVIKEKIRSGEIISEEELNKIINDVQVDGQISLLTEV